MEENKPNYQTFVVNSAKYKTLLTQKFENRKSWVRPDPKEIFSYIPGTIVEIKIKPGQKVKKGDVILILEAMKMQNKVEMPFAGTIKKVNIEEGQKIPKNYLMIEIE
jgi:biotin carboxyl carrier protein